MKKIVSRNKSSFLEPLDVFVAEGYRKESDKITWIETSINGSRFHVENKEESSERIGDARSRIEILIHVSSIMYVLLLDWHEDARERHRIWANR